MSPLIPIAINLLPELAKRLTGSGKSKTQDVVASIVREVLHTDDPAEAALAAQDPAKAAELRIRLAEIEAEAEASKRAADLAHEEAIRQKQKDELEAMLARMEAQRATETARRDAEFRDLEARLGSQADAREKAQQAADSGSVYRYGPLSMSVIVTVGFFVLLILLIVGRLQAMDPAVIQIINIGFGTLTAGFATVISFWLGSSESSRQKDGLNRELQQQRSLDTKEFLNKQSENTQQLFKQVDRVATMATPATSARTDNAAATGKGPKHFGKCADLILANEAAYGTSPVDPRGRVNMGISLKTLAAWRQEEVDEAALGALEASEARNIYRNIFWNALGCQDLPAGLDLAIFDFAVDLGVTNAAKALQSIVAVETDGQIGPVTLTAVSQFAPAGLLEELYELRKTIYENREGAATLGTNWQKRLREIHETARTMLKT